MGRRWSRGRGSGVGGVGRVLTAMALVLNGLDTTLSAVVSSCDL